MRAYTENECRHRTQKKKKSATPLQDIDCNKHWNDACTEAKRGKNSDLLEVCERAFVTGLGDALHGLHLWTRVLQGQLPTHDGLHLFSTETAQSQQWSWCMGQVTQKNGTQYGNTVEEKETLIRRQNRNKKVVVTLLRLPQNHYPKAWFNQKAECCTKEVDRNFKKIMNILKLPWISEYQETTFYIRFRK